MPRDDEEKLTLTKAMILVESYTPEKYTKELPDKLLYALAKAEIWDEEDIDRLP